MLISVVIPTFQAQSTVARAARSALEQTCQDIEVIIVADDDFNYRSFLLANSVADERLRFIATGRVGSGCHNARNVGLAAARGEFVAALDADDILLPTKFSVLLPPAKSDGAATDNPQVTADESGITLYRAFDQVSGRWRLDVESLLNCSVPLFPLVAREYAEPRLPGIELGEDFVANLRLIDRLGSLTILGETLSQYRVVTGSLSHSDTSAAGFERSYTALIERLTTGDKLGLSLATATLARDALIRKRDFNRAFAAAKAEKPNLDFQTFAANRRR